MKTGSKREIDKRRFATLVLLCISLVWSPVIHAQQTTQEWQAAATKEFPQLAVKDSPFNRAYLAAYGVLKNQASKSLNAPEIFYLLAVATSQVLADSPNNSPDPPSLGKAVADKIPEFQTAIAKIDSRSFVAGAEIKEVDAEGALCSTYTTKSIVHKEDHVQQNQTMLGPGMISHRKTQTFEVQKTPVNDSVFIAGLHDVAPGREWSGRIWPAGTADSHGATEALTHVERWAASRSDAIKLSFLQSTQTSAIASKGSVVIGGASGQLSQPESDVYKTKSSIHLVEDLENGDLVVELPALGKSIVFHPANDNDCYFARFPVGRWTKNNGREDCYGWFNQTEQDQLPRIIDTFHSWSAKYALTLKTDPASVSSGISKQIDSIQTLAGKSRTYIFIANEDGTTQLSMDQLNTYDVDFDFYKSVANENGTTTEDVVARSLASGQKPIYKVTTRSFSSEEVEAFVLLSKNFAAFVNKKGQYDKVQEQVMNEKKLQEEKTQKELTDRKNKFIDTLTR